MDIPLIYQEMIDLLPRGSENPMPLKEVASLLHLDKRTVLEYANAISIHYGVPILASRKYQRNGLYIPVTEKERREGLIPLKNQVLEMTKRIDAIEKAELLEMR